MSTPAKYYTTIHRLPFDRFEDCICDETLSPLIIEGQPAEEELLTAWDTIIDEYEQAMGDLKQAAFIKKYVELKALEIKRDQVTVLIDTLQNIGYIKRFADRLNQILKLSLAFDVMKPEEYERDLKKCAGILRGSISLNIRLKAIELETLAKHNQGQNVKPTRESYGLTFLSLSKYMGYPVRKHETTVFDFCKMVKAMNRDIEAQKSVSKK